MWSIVAFAVIGSTSALFGQARTALSPADETVALLRRTAEALESRSIEPEEEAAFRALMQRFGEQARAKQAHGAFSSALKYYGAELNKRRQELIMSALGSDALDWRRSAPRDWLRSKANSIEGGTSEVQLNVIAKRILELPGA